MGVLVSSETPDLGPGTSPLRLCHYDSVGVQCSKSLTRCLHQLQILCQGFLAGQYLLVGQRRLMKMSPFEEEEQRLAAVKALNLLDKPEEERFGRLTRLARRHFKASACAITLVDRERKFCVAQHGLQHREYPVEQGVTCNKVVSSGGPLIINDMAETYRSTSSEARSQNLGMNFYAGVPIFSPEGLPVGTLCIFDHKSREFDRREMESLADFASLVEDELSLRHADTIKQELVSQVESLRMRAYIDPLTEVWNRGALLKLLSQEIERCQRADRGLTIGMLDIDHFKVVNDTHGHPAGDEVLKELCVRIRKTIRAYDSLGRYGGEEFVLLFPESGAEDGPELGERVRTVVEQTPFTIGPNNSIPITVSIGITKLREGDSSTEMLARADAALYAAKHSGRNRVCTE